MTFWSVNGNVNEHTAVNAACSECASSLFLNKYTSDYWIFNSRISLMGLAACCGKSLRLYLMDMLPLVVWWPAHPHHSRTHTHPVPACITHWLAESSLKWLENKSRSGVLWNYCQIEICTALLWPITHTSPSVCMVGICFRAFAIIIGSAILLAARFPDKDLLLSIMFAFEFYAFMYPLAVPSVSVGKPFADTSSFTILN